ncbi:hypothetical protein E3W21_06930 [Pseudomonas sp. F01002]|nr:hypothetical protein E3W21_06930 [Pseudomonas sp. F01002]
MIANDQGYTESQKKLMWDRWQKGDFLQQIAQLFDRNHSSIQRILAKVAATRLLGCEALLDAYAKTGFRGS